MKHTYVRLAIAKFSHFFIYFSSTYSAGHVRMRRRECYSSIFHVTWRIFYVTKFICLVIIPRMQIWRTATRSAVCWTSRMKVKLVRLFLIMLPKQVLLRLLSGLIHYAMPTSCFESESATRSIEIFRLRLWGKMVDQCTDRLRRREGVQDRRGNLSLLRLGDLSKIELM